MRLMHPGLAGLAVAVTMPTMRTLMATLSLTIAIGCGGSTASSRDGGGPADATSPDGTQMDTGSESDTGADGTSINDSGAGMDVAEGDAGADSGWSPVCPGEQPTLGSSCDGGGVCEYNQAWWSIECSLVIECGAGNQWTQTSMCIGPCVPAPGPNDPQCPASPMGITQASPCPFFDAGLTCNWYQGITCDCHAAIIGDPDAGGQWLCDPGPACPPTRPRLGASCGPNPLGCKYAALAMQCTNGIWVAGPNCGL